MNNNKLAGTGVIPCAGVLIVDIPLLLVFIRCFFVLVFSIYIQLYYAINQFNLRISCTMEIIGEIEGRIKRLSDKIILVL